MNNALTFTLNLQNSGFQAPAQDAVAKIDSIGAAAARANQNLLQLQSGLVVSSRAGNLGAVAASSIASGTMFYGQSQALAQVAQNGTRATNALKGLAAGAKAFKGVGTQLGLLFLPGAAIQIIQLTMLVKSLKTALSETGSVGARILPLLGPIGVGVAAGLTVRFIIQKDIEAWEAKAGAEQSKSDLFDQQEANRKRLAAMLDASVTAGNLGADQAGALKRGLIKEGGIKAAQQALAPFWISDRRTDAQRGLDNLAREASYSGMNPLQRKLADVQKRFADRMRELDVLKQSSSNADLAKVGSVEAQIKASARREWAQEIRDFYASRKPATAAAPRMAENFTAYRVPVTDIERQGFVFRGGLGPQQDTQRTTAANTTKMVATLIQIRDKITKPQSPTNN